MRSKGSRAFFALLLSFFLLSAVAILKSDASAGPASLVGLGSRDLDHQVVRQSLAPPSAAEATPTPLPGPGSPGYPVPGEISLPSPEPTWSAYPAPGTTSTSSSGVWPSVNAGQPTASAGEGGQGSTVVLGISIWQLAAGAAVGLFVGFVLGRRQPGRRP